jgi:diguanylate cyclase (GGDEF)-like protein
VVLALALSAGALAFLALGAGTARAREVVGELALLPIGAAATVLALRVARRRDLDPRLRRAWGWIAAAFALNWAGDTLWVLYDLPSGGDVPFPSVADLGYLAFYPCLMAGLLSLPARRPTEGEREKVALDALTVLLGGAMVVWYLVIEPTLRQHEAGALAVGVSLAYPLGDLMLLFATAVVLLRRPRASAGSLWLLLAGAGLFVFSDLGFAVAELSGGYQGGGWLDAGWILAGAVMAASAARQLADRPAPVGPDPADLAPPRVSRLPYLAVLVAYALLAFVVQSEGSSTLSGLVAGAGLLTGLVVLRQLNVVRENARLVGELHRLAVTDPLTGLQNRRSFVEGVERELAQARREARPVAAIMIDIDRFKLVNDAYGHAAGDAVLLEVARRCRQELRLADLVARYGGDELVVFVTGAGPAEAAATAERLRERVLAEPVRTDAGPIAVTLSLGVAAAGPGHDLDGLLLRADHALYAAKEAGRNRVRLWDDQTAGV